MAYIFVKTPTDQEPHTWQLTPAWDDVIKRCDLDDKSYSGFYAEDSNHEIEESQPIGDADMMVLTVAGADIVGSGKTLYDVINEIENAIKATVNSQHKGKEWSLIAEMCNTVVDLQQFHPESEVFVVWE